MMADVLTVMWKEWRELLRQRESMRGGIARILIFVGVFGVFLPLQMGREWVESPRLLMLWAWVPLFLVTSVVADSFAGERERHTLETLLASRLSDRSILFGKISAALSYGFGLALIGIVLGLVTVNLVHGKGELLLYSPMIAVSIIGLMFLGAGLAAGAGVLVSLRASSVRQAQQTMTIAIMLLLFVPIYSVQALPENWKMPIAKLFINANTTQLVFIAITVLVVIDILLFVAAMARFKRARLILD
jgi:ABC-2 type transport system permease protein